MIALNNVGKWKKCNLWIDEVPEMQYDCESVLNGVIVKKEWTNWDNSFYAIELRVIGRDCSNYALLGMRYEYKDVEELAINVNVSEFDGRVVEREISSVSGEIHCGLPLEYAKKVFDVTRDCLENTTCSQGEITVDIAAHGDVGSSQLLFESITKILLQLLINNDKNDIEKIEKIIFNQLKPE